MSIEHSHKMLSVFLDGLQTAGFDHSKITWLKTSLAELYKMADTMVHYAPGEKVYLVKDYCYDSLEGATWVALTEGTVVSNTFGFDLTMHANVSIDPYKDVTWMIPYTHLALKD